METNEIVIKISNEESEELLNKDCECKMYDDVITNFMSEHAHDTTNKAIESPMFKKFKEQAITAREQFSKAKDAVIDKYIDADTQKKVTRWSIKYSTAELVYSIE
jgi:hypothetical protein